MKLKLFVWKTLAVFSVLLCLAVISCAGQTNVDLVPQGNSSDQQNPTDPDPNQNQGSGDTQNVYYTITFKTDHGTTPKSIQVLDGAELSSDDLPVLTADGYTFDGWSCGFQRITKDSKLTVIDNEELIANWKKNNLEISVSIGSEENQAEQNFTVTAQKSQNGTDYILTATSGYDYYVWSIETPENTGAPTNSNTFSFNETMLPNGFKKDGTYVIYVQAYNTKGNNYEHAGLAFVVVKMEEED